jgi:predicted deacylase
MAFSEPEADALRALVEAEKPQVAVFWHSQANAVYASECENGILPETRSAMNAYATAGGYKAVDTFDAYSVTGDAEGWLASIGIPAITVELATSNTTEWEKNRAGIEAIIALYAAASP